MSWLVYPTRASTEAKIFVSVYSEKQIFRTCNPSSKTKRDRFRCCYLINGDFVSIKMDSIKKNGRNGEIVGRCGKCRSVQKSVLGRRVHLADKQCTAVPPGQVPPTTK